MQNRTIILPILLGALLVACGEKKQPADTKPAPPPPPADTAQAPPQEQHPPMVLKKPSFQEQVIEDYASAAASLPKQVSDSILHNFKSDPRKMEQVMTAYLHHQDTLARMEVAGKYGITMDSLNMIIKQHDKDAGK